MKLVLHPGSLAVENDQPARSRPALAQAGADGRCATVAMRMAAKQPIFDFLQSRGARLRFEASPELR
jgi:hypothetical protein